MPTSRAEFQGFAPRATIFQAYFRGREERWTSLFSISTYWRATAMAATTYPSDPFEGEINPGSTSGQKLYTLATADRKKEELLLVAQENVSEIMSEFRHDSNSFGWDPLSTTFLRKITLRS